MNLHSGAGRSAPHAAIARYYWGVARSRGNDYSVDGRIRQIRGIVVGKAESGLVVGYFDRDFVRIGALWTAFSYRGDDVEVMSTADHLAVLVSRRFKLTLVDSIEGTAGHFAAINVKPLCGNIVVGPIKRYGVRSR